MLELLNRPGRTGLGLSRRGQKGGSIGEYASKISHLIKFCYKSQRDLYQINDGIFSAFISSLRTSTDRCNNKRSENTVTAIGKACLNFLEFIGRLYGDENFVAPQGAIRVSEEMHVTTTRAGKRVARKYLHHHTFSMGGEIRIRDPISDFAIEMLRHAIDESQSSRLVQSRRHTLLSLLKHTGARRGEIGNIRVLDIHRANKMAEPMLKLETWKSNANSERYIPISKMILNEIIKYIELHRRKAVKTLRIDHGFLFVSERTGKKMAAESLTNEVAVLRRASGINEKACPHMFRHAFVTNLFCLLIERHKLNTPDDFNRHLLDTPHFIAEVMLWTGHLDPASVQRYINLAFAKTSNLIETISSTHLIRTVEIYDMKSQELLKELRNNGISAERYIDELEQLIILRDIDLKRYDPN